MVRDDADTNTLVTEEKYQISNLEKTHGDEMIRVTTDFYSGFPIPSAHKFPLQITADGACEHRIEVRYQHKPDVQPSYEGISNLHFSYLDKVWVEGTVLKFKTRVIPYREVVEQKNMAAYETDAEAMSDRATSVFPGRVEANSRPGWMMAIAALLMAGVTLGFLI